MRIARPRFTVRRGMALVALSATILVGARWSWAWVRLASAHANYARGQKYYDEGRITPWILIQRSTQLMEAEFHWDGSPSARIHAIEAHLGRAEVLVARLREELLTLGCCRGCIAEVAEAEQSRDEAEMTLAREKRLFVRANEQAPIR